MIATIFNINNNYFEIIKKILKILKFTFKKTKHYLGTMLFNILDSEWSLLSKH